MAWRRIEEGAPQAWVTVHIEGLPVKARSGDSVAVAMLAAGVAVFRETPVSGAPRAPLCLMGVCFECLVEIDGRPNMQACMVPVAEGMQVRRQHGAPHLQDEHEAVDKRPA
jgi:predicted molibdopterin-dependent oxidoreductase YjgC